MTLLSLFMASTGIFCFVPISQRLVESGIISESGNSWRFRRLPSVLSPTLRARKEEKPHFLLSAEEAEVTWPEPEERHQLQSPVQIYAVDDMFTTDQPLPMPCSSESNTDAALPRACFTTDSLLQSTPINTLYGRESASFTSATQDSTLCDSCDTLLRREIPPDHIPSVIRALALFEAHDQFSSVVFNECEVIALTNAFSMLRL